MPAVAGAETAGDPYIPRSGNGGYRVASYDLDLTYRVPTNRLEGTATLTIVTDQKLSRFSLDLVGLGVKRVRVDGRKTPFRHADGKVRITPEKALAAGATVTVVVEYAGAPRPRRSRWGTIGWEELDDGVLVASQPSGAPSWYPCNDHPSDKATYRVTFATDAAYTVIASGALVSRRIVGGRGVWRFEQAAPTPTYLVAVQVGRLASVPVDLAGVAGTLHRPAAIAPVVDRELERLPEMMTLFERTFGPYPFDGYGVVVTEDEIEIPLEAQGIATFGSNHLDGSGREERLVAHELAHQWFGNSVGLRRWSDIWLNEGFCCYAEWLWSEASGSERVETLARRHHRALASAPQDLLLVDPGVDDMFDDRVYKRGALAVHALRVFAGDAVFTDILHAWTTRYRHGLATTDDLLALAEELAPGATAVLAPWLAERALPAFPR
ncbi:M1 family metallopeptidase [Agromyces atrinae]|uniref:Aminopeptidase N n=1 Tax=Agromyces atrinae TaxID=592376 RepID=A0A4Q2M7G1_9MICO|nr:M1 family metallopeptidase [Agromyces atrinae]NYD67608.1 aminopeptidase N [Agromyces atrinae]RXZ88184.1 M1 family peptidase [Agromyces atrinae]